MLTRNQYALYTNLKKRVNCSEKSTQTDLPNKKPKYLIKYEETTTDSEDYSEYSDEDENEDESLLFVDSNNTLIKEINKAIHAELKKHTSDTKTSFIDNLNAEEFEYFNSLSKEDKATYENTYNIAINYNNKNIPLKFRILNQTHSTPYVQQLALKKYQILQNMEESRDTNGEYHKLNNWLRTLCCVPFGNIVNLPVNHKSSNQDVVKFISSTKEILNKSVYGHDTTKDQIIRIIAQLISNPNSKGNVIGIHGDPGVGKTTLIKDGVCKALKLPFAFIPLGGAGDSSYLEGHSYTYEGSSHGKIVDVLIQSKCMNPVLYFDELDKLSDSVKGKELNNILIHITDPAQNENFTDKYFSGIPFDLSKCIIIFTYNNISKIDPILLDRMITIHANSYTSIDKVNILKNYLLPYMISQFNMPVQIEDDTILYLINKTDAEPGVRNLKRSLEKIMSNLNLEKYTNDTSSLSDIKITNKMIDQYIEQKATFDVISHLYS
jgi:ATP-dependent Lon protease